MSYDLFNQPPNNFSPFLATSIPNVINDISDISGLIYIPNYITKEQENSFIKSINAESWLTDIKRRVQHYGYKYDYKARAIDYSMFLGALPSWASAMAKRLYLEKQIDQEPDQLIINEYLPGQGIANHVDCEPCFGETVISISLGSYCVMDFINIKSRHKIEVMLEPGSMVVITGEARHLWSHGIAQRKTDFFNGKKYDRNLRISMTFRKVILK